VIDSVLIIFSRICTKNIAGKSRISSIIWFGTEKPEEKWGPLTTKRAKDISTAVFDQPEVLAAGKQAAQLQVSEITATIKKELWNFQRDPALGSFNIDYYMLDC
jgi:hypothetical protein